MAARKRNVARFYRGPHASPRWNGRAAQSPPSVTAPHGLAVNAPIFLAYTATSVLPGVPAVPRCLPSSPHNGWLWHAALQVDRER